MMSVVYKLDVILPMVQKNNNEFRAVTCECDDFHAKIAEFKERDRFIDELLSRVKSMRKEKRFTLN